MDVKSELSKLDGLLGTGREGGGQKGGVPQKKKRSHQAVRTGNQYI